MRSQSCIEEDEDEEDEEETFNQRPENAELHRRCGPVGQAHKKKNLSNAQNPEMMIMTFITSEGKCRKHGLRKGKATTSHACGLESAELELLPTPRNRI